MSWATPQREDSQAGSFGLCCYLSLIGNILGEVSGDGFRGIFISFLGVLSQGHGLQ